MTAAILPVDHDSLNTTSTYIYFSEFLEYPEDMLSWYYIYILYYAHIINIHIQIVVLLYCIYCIILFKFHSLETIYYLHTCVCSWFTTTLSVQNNHFIVITKRMLHNYYKMVIFYYIVLSYKTGYMSVTKTLQFIATWTNIIFF